MRRVAVVVAALVLPIVLAACGHEGKNLSGVHQVNPPGSEAPSPDKPANPHEGMPAPHGEPANPHAGVPPATPPAAPAARPVGWTAPQGWTESAPTSSMRMAQFDVGKDAAGAPVQAVVFQGIGGDDQSNIDRWIGQMGTTKDAPKIAESEAGGVKVKRVEAHGTFSDSMTGGVHAPESTMFASIVTLADGTKLHVKLVGPSSVVDPQAANFDAFVASIKPR